MSKIEVGTIFRINERNTRYQLLDISKSRKSYEDLIALSERLLYVVVGFDEDVLVTYPVKSQIHPLYSHLVEPGVFYTKHSISEMEVVDHDPEPEVP